MKQNKNTAIAALVLSFFFWLWLFNYITSALAIYYAIKSLRRIKSSPKKYGGKWMAIAAIILGTSTYFFLIIAIVMKYVFDIVVY